MYRPSQASAGLRRHSQAFAGFRSPFAGPLSLAGLLSFAGLSFARLQDLGVRTTRKSVQPKPQYSFRDSAKSAVKVIPTIPVFDKVLRLVYRPSSLPLCHSHIEAKSGRVYTTRPIVTTLTTYLAAGGYDHPWLACLGYT